MEFGGVILVFPVNCPARLEVGEKLVADIFLGWAIQPGAVAQGAIAETHIPDLEPCRGLGTNLGGGWEAASSLVGTRLVFALERVEIIRSTRDSRIN